MNQLPNCFDHSQGSALKLLIRQLGIVAWTLQSRSPTYGDQPAPENKREYDFTSGYHASLCNHSLAQLTGRQIAPRVCRSIDLTRKVKCLRCFMMGSSRRLFSSCHVDRDNGHRNYKTLTLYHVGCDLLFHNFRTGWPRYCRLRRSYNGTLCCAPVGERLPIR